MRSDISGVLYASLVYALWIIWCSTFLLKKTPHCRRLFTLDLVARPIFSLRLWVSFIMQHYSAIPHNPGKRKIKCKDSLWSCVGKNWTIVRTKVSFPMAWHLYTNTLIFFRLPLALLGSTVSRTSWIRAVKTKSWASSWIGHECMTFDGWSLFRSTIRLVNHTWWELHDEGEVYFSLFDSELLIE